MLPVVITYLQTHLTRALPALVGVGLSLDPEGKEGRLVRTGCWHLGFPMVNHTFRAKI